MSEDSTDFGDQNDHHDEHHEGLFPQPSTTVIVPSEEDTKLNVDAAIDFVGGVAGGVASVYIGQPLDTVKVKLQTFPYFYKNAWHCFKVTLKNEGITRGLYAGTLPSLAAQVSENAVLFMAYGMCQKAVMTLLGKSHIQHLNPVENAISGGLAAFWSSIVLCPTELVKCRLQSMEQLRQTGELHGTLVNKATRKIGPLDVTRQILKTEGLKGLFQGFVPTLYREMPGYFFFFGGYEVAKKLFSEYTGSTSVGSVGTVVSGAVGGVSLWVAVFPADVVKSRIQVLSQDGKVKSGFFSTVAHIAKTEGVPALYKGLGPCVLRTIPATGGLFLAYETTKDYLTQAYYRPS